MKNNSRIIYRIFQIATIVLFAAGFSLVKLWPGVIILLIMLPCWWFSHRLNSKVISGAILILFGGIAACGLLSNTSSYLMVGGMTTALACWELEDHMRESAKSSISFNTRLNEKTHLQTLLIAVFIGLILGETGLLINFTLPFGIVLLTALVVLFCIFQLFSIFRNNQLD